LAVDVVYSEFSQANTEYFDWNKARILSRNCEISLRQNLTFGVWSFPVGHRWRNEGQFSAKAASQALASV